ncbi:hypothetical protein LVJ94_46000 [Pendulispora rubella]|uniref:YfhO family protein n=1 Tax=Pendulispora rubella TaxID=2741070 RepID=A0ABZ2L4W6_9BACT
MDPEPPIPSLRWRILLLGLLSVGMGVFAWYTMLGNYPRTQFGDGQMFHKGIEAARVSVVRYHELPLWNPYECGGNPLWDNPEQMAAAPLLWPVLFLGTTVEVYFWCIIHGALGFLAMWLFGRHELRLTRVATFLAASIWAFCGFHQQHASTGHLSFASFEYFPLAILLWRRAETDLRAAAGLGALVAWMLYEAGTYSVPHLALFLAAETLTRAWPAKRFVPIGRAAAVVVAVTVIVGAARLFPLVAQLGAHTRALEPETDHLTWQTLRDMFLVRQHGWGAAGQTYVWPEYWAYLGPIVVVLGLVGIALAGIEYAWLVALLVLAFVLMCGHFAPWAPWSILKGHIFPFKEMRVPARFRCEVSLFLAAFCGIAIDRLRQLAQRKVPSHATTIGAFIVALGFVGVGDLLSTSLIWIETRWPQAPESHPMPSTRLYYGGPGLAPFIDQPQQNRGRLDCWGEWGSFYSGAPLWEGDVPQARGATKDVVVEVGNRTQNTFSIDAVLTRPGRVLVNSSYDRAWRTDVGTLVEVNRQLVLELPEGRHHVHLRYWPIGLTAGLLLSTFGTAAVVAYFVWDARRKRHQRLPYPA